jgi:hypothetical protein
MLPSGDPGKVICRGCGHSYETMSQTRRKEVGVRQVPQEVRCKGGLADALELDYPQWLL